MSWKYSFFILFIAFFIVNCSKTKEIQISSSKVLNPSDIKGFHPEINIKIGWIPYKGQKLVKTGKDNWKIVSHSDSDKVGSIPTMIISYPDSDESIMLDMNIKNDLLGKLIKHSAMTNVPIERPFTQFFEDAKCESCHPSDVPVDFGNVEFLNTEKDNSSLKSDRYLVE